MLSILLEFLPIDRRVWGEVWVTHVSGAVHKYGFLLDPVYKVEPSGDLRVFTERNTYTYAHDTWSKVEFFDDSPTVTK